MGTQEIASDLVTGLRGLADFIEREPEFARMIAPVTLYAWMTPDSPAEFAQMALRLGTFDKGADDSFFNADKQFSPRLTLQLTARRELVCERVVVGVEEVEILERDPQRVDEAMASIPFVKSTRTIETVEWVCPPSLSELAR